MKRKAESKARAPVAAIAERSMCQGERAHRSGCTLEETGAAAVPHNIALELNDLNALNDRFEVLAKDRGELSSA